MDLTPLAIGEALALDGHAGKAVYLHVGEVARFVVAVRSEGQACAGLFQ